MSEYQLNTGKIGEKVVDAFVDTFLEKKDDKKAEENKEAQKYEGGISNAALLCICFIR